MGGVALARRAARYEAFRPFGLDSYGKGLLDFTIPDRPIIAEGDDERVQRLIAIEAIQTPELLALTGLPADAVAAIVRGRERRRWMRR